MGWKTVGYVEWDDYCQQVIAARIKDGIFDYAPIFTDIRTFATEYARKYRGLVDIITAGFPCQPFSTAGKQKADNDERNMWKPTLQVIQAVQPKWALLENVPGLLGKHRYFETILKDLSEAGYDAHWTCMSAAETGAPHKRERLWIVATNTKSDGLEGSCRSECSSESHGQGVQPISTGVGSNNGKWWEIEPNVGRVANGTPNGSKRLKALGNGQVPAVVRAAWKELTHEH